MKARADFRQRIVLILCLVVVVSGLQGPSGVRVDGEAATSYLKATAVSGGSCHREEERSLAFEASPCHPPFALA